MSRFCSPSDVTVGLTRLEACFGFLGTTMVPTACFSVGARRAGAGVKIFGFPVAGLEANCRGCGVGLGSSTTCSGGRGGGGIGATFGGKAGACGFGTTTDSSAPTSESVTRSGFGASPASVLGGRRDLAGVLFRSRLGGLDNRQRRKRRRRDRRHLWGQGQGLRLWHDHGLQRTTSESVTRSGFGGFSGLCLGRRRDLAGVLFRSRLGGLDNRQRRKRRRRDRRHLWGKARACGFGTTTDSSAPTSESVTRSGFGASPASVLGGGGTLPAFCSESAWGLDNLQRRKRRRRDRRHLWGQGQGLRFRHDHGLQRTHERIRHPFRVLGLLRPLSWAEAGPCRRSVSESAWGPRQPAAAEEAAAGSAPPLGARPGLAALARPRTPAHPRANPSPVRVLGLLRPLSWAEAGPCRRSVSESAWGPRQPAAAEEAAAGSAPPLGARPGLAALARPRTPAHPRANPSPVPAPSASPGARNWED